MSTLPLAALLLLCLAPDVRPLADDVREDFDLTGFYAQGTLVHGLPVVGSERVQPHAIAEAAYLIEMMLGHRPDLLQAMARRKVRFTVMARDEWTTDVPEHADLSPARYWDRRARGLGATLARPSVSCGEENLLAFPGDPYSTENILIHEFAHAIHEIGLRDVDPTFNERLVQAFRSAGAEGRWANTYASSNTQEYWAEGVQSFFDTNRENDDQHGEVDTREELASYDPALHALCIEVFGSDAARYVHVSERLAEPHLSGWDPEKAPRFEWPRAMVEAYGQHMKEQMIRPRAGESGSAFDRRAAESGSVEAMVRLGMSLRDGRGAEQDPEEAVAWFERAAELGYVPAWDHLGWMLENGLGCEVDLPRAFVLYRQAAKARNRQARFNLGRLYRDGLGTPQDGVLAAMWLRLAADARHRAARLALAEHEANLSDEDRARAVRLAKAWR